MSRNKLYLAIFSLMIVFSMLLTACGTTIEVPSESAVNETVADLQSQIEALNEQLKSAASEVNTENVPDPALQAQLDELQMQLKAVQNRTVIEFWTTDNEEVRVKLYEEVAERYMALHPEVEIRIVPIEEAGISQRISTAVAANRLPSIVRMGIERVASFAADGLLDENAADATINAIGKDDFRKGPLMMVTDAATNQYAAVPFDGWIQAIWYRQDVFTTLGLAAPVKWDDITAACKALPGNDNLLYGIGLGTDPGQNYGHQVFEQVAISNNAWPFDEAGNVTMDTPEMVAALTFYAGLQDCAIPGPQYWRGSREAYEYGQSGMLFYSTYIMDDLVDGSGKEDGSVVELVYPDLAARTGFAPSMEGPGGAASYGQLVALGIMRDADPVAQDVVKFFLEGQNYQDVLALAPFGKVPVLESAVEEWKSSSDYFGNYPPETLEAIAAGYDSMQRWLFRPDYDATQRAVVGDIEGRLLIPQVLSNIAIEKSMTPAQAATWLQEQVEILLTERTQ